MKKKSICILLIILCLTLCACGNMPTEKTRITVEPKSPSADSTVFSFDESIEGDWYGRLEISGADGDWTDAEGRCWDCCASLSADNCLLIWNEVLPKDYFLAELKLENEGGFLRCLGGSFMDIELGEGEWDADLSVDASGKRIVITGRYEAVNSDGSFTGRIILRPWGAVWLCDEAQLPEHYHDWYLPLIEQNGEMPEELPKESEK